MQTSLLRGAPFQQAQLAQRRSVIAYTKRQKKARVILATDIYGLGKAGEVADVKLGYWRNYLLPNGMAKVASKEILESLYKKQEEEKRLQAEEKVKAQTYANALASIGKFVLKKKASDKDTLYGSVQAAEIADLIIQQTGRRFELEAFTLPDIQKLGSYECQLRVHPEVKAAFVVVVQKENSAEAAGEKQESKSK